jgi:hypothetical protein
MPSLIRTPTLVTVVHFTVLLPKSEPTPVITSSPLPVLPGFWVFRGTAMCGSCF